MTWNRARSEGRIRKFAASAPQFDEHISLAEYSRMALDARLKAQATPGRAFTVTSAHLYGLLLDFDNVVVENDQETETSHKNVLRLLHIHYSLWDSIVEKEDADRVDYHGARLHSVVTEPNNDPREQILQAIALAVQLRDASRRVGAAYGIPARIRFAIDQGKCLAMTTGRGHEQDTLFLGAPANYAAKLVASGNTEGVFLTPEAQKILGVATLSENMMNDARAKYRFDRLAQTEQKLLSEINKVPQFAFRRATPPLADLRFADLSPSRSVRMGMASIFADIDGFTRYVDAAISKGSNAIKAAATRIHVIREELNAVLRDDFGGKRIRFIGDCIQGVIAAGERADVASDAIRESALCAAGMRSSFNLCQEILGQMDTLDLAVGVEYGPVPVTRLGKAGEESVRCAAGRAVVTAERMQQSIQGGGIKFGPIANSLADKPTRDHFSLANKILAYDSAIDLLGTMTSPAVAKSRSAPEARPHSK